MFKQLEGARLGIFIFLGTVMLVLSIFLLGNKEKLFSSTIEIKAYFNQIEGLKPGAPVRLSGYDVGSVQSISLESGSNGRVEVVLNIDIALKKFIRIDSQAAVETEGLVGKRLLQSHPAHRRKRKFQMVELSLQKIPLTFRLLLKNRKQL